MALQPESWHLFADFPVKRVFVAAIVLFEVGSVICATARSFVALIVGRLVAGAGGGGLSAGTLTFIGLAVHIRKRLSLTLMPKLSFWPGPQQVWLVLVTQL